MRTSPPQSSCLGPHGFQHSCFRYQFAPPSTIKIWQCPINVPIKMLYTNYAAHRVYKLDISKYIQYIQDIKDIQDIQDIHGIPSGASGPGRAGRPRRRLVFRVYLVYLVYFLYLGYLGYIWIYPICAPGGPQNYCKAS